MEKRPFFPDYDTDYSFFGERFHEQFVQNPERWKDTRYHYFGKITRLPKEKDNVRLEAIQTIFHRLTPSMKEVKFEVRPIYMKEGERAPHGFFHFKSNRIFINSQFISKENYDGLTLDDLAIHEWTHALTQFSEEDFHGSIFSEGHHQLYQKLFDEHVLSSEEIEAAAKRTSRYVSHLSTVGVMSQEELQGHQLLLAKVGVTPGYWF